MIIMLLSVVYNENLHQGQSQQGNFLDVNNNEQLQQQFPNGNGLSFTSPKIIENRIYDSFRIQKTNLYIEVRNCTLNNVYIGFCENIKFIDCFFPIILSGDKKINIHNSSNVIIDRSTQPISRLYVSFCRNISITNNSFGNGEYSLKFYNSSFITLQNNQFLDSNIVVFQSIDLKIDESNLVKGKPIISRGSEMDRVLDGHNYSNVGMILLIDCQNFEIRNFKITQISIPIIVENSNNISIHNNELSDGKYGIQLSGSLKCKIFQNNISNFDGYGIYLLSSYLNKIYDNNFSGLISNHNTILDGEYSSTNFYDWVQKTYIHLIFYQRYPILIGLVALGFIIILLKIRKNTVPIEDIEDNVAVSFTLEHSEPLLSNIQSFEEIKQKFDVITSTTKKFFYSMHVIAVIGLFAGVNLLYMNTEFHYNNYISGLYNFYMIATVCCLITTCVPISLFGINLTFNWKLNLIFMILYLFIPWNVGLNLIPTPFAYLGFILLLIENIALIWAEIGGKKFN